MASVKLNEKYEQLVGKAGPFAQAKQPAAYLEDYGTEVAPVV